MPSLLNNLIGRRARHIGPATAVLVGCFGTREAVAVVAKEGICDRAAFLLLFFMGLGAPVIVILSRRPFGYFPTTALLLLDWI